MNTFGKRWMIKCSLLAVLMLVIAPLVPSSSLAAASTEIEHYQVPIDQYVYVPCAAGGTGEYVYLTGTLHVLMVFTLDDGGGYHAQFLFRPQRVTGTGLLTGDQYHATGETRGSTNGRIGFESSYVNNFKIIGAGRGNNLLVFEVFHFTFNVNGDVTVLVDHFRVECR
jgi:hypothetical protein